MVSTAHNLPILVVDDNLDACTLVAKMLRACGYEAEIAQDGASALALVEQQPFGMAIVDYRMPGMNGVELFRRMRQMRPELAGVFVTGFTTIDVVYPAIEAGILHVMSKPVD